MPKPGTFVCGVCSCSWLISAIFLLSFSFDTLNPRTMGLLYNANTLYLQSDKLYNQNNGDSGRYFTGLGQRFIYFPRGIINVKFNSEGDADGPTISAKTFNGTSVSLDMAFQFVLERTPAEVTALYLDYGQSYTSFFIKYARQIVRDVVSDHFVFDLWEKRQEMGDAVRTALDAKLQQRHAAVVGVQLLSLSIPQEIQDAIETTSVAFQNIGEARFEKEAETVRATTRRLVAEKTAEVLVLQAQATASTTLFNANATAQARTYTLEAEAAAFNFTKTTMSMSNTQLLKYAWLDSMLDNNAQGLTLGVQQPSSTKLA